MKGFSMLEGLKSKLQSVRTISRLCQAAEAYALQDGQHEPGAEHFLLAAFDLPDGTARLAFEELGADPQALRSAIADQYGDALRAIGIEAEKMPDPSGTARLQVRNGPFAAAPSGQEIMQELAAQRGEHRPLLGAHIVAVVAGMSQGVAARALRSMGVDRDALKAQAKAIAAR
jgi:ATP-dependent Clp protease ATP-binding subunit ClpA